jgi:hypothetical protein
LAITSLPPNIVTQLSGLLCQYITAQREKYRSVAVALTDQEKSKMAGFFSPEVLDEARLMILRGDRLANPDFYPMLRAMGFDNLPDLSLMEATTFSDTVVSHRPFTDGLLFHELVHVEQYRQLGVPRFAELYIGGFLSGGGYDGIPLEKNAYGLGGRYEAAPGSYFSVAADVAGWISSGLF